MPDMHALVAFAVMSFVLIVVPGPSVLFVIGRSLALGRRGGLMSVLGNELGGLPLVLLVSVGLGAVVAQSAMVFLVVKLLGAGYLVYLGLQAIRHRRVDTGAMASAARQWFATSLRRLSTMRATGGGMLVGMGATLALAKS